MKRFKEGNTALVAGKILARLVIISFIITNSVSAQIELNNFGVTNKLKTHLGYTKFFVIDYNNDDQKDLFLFGNQEKSFVLHKGLKDSTFSEAVRKFFFFPIDDFKWLNKSATGDDYYIFASRNKRLVGLVSFTKSYSLQLLNTIQFDSYPSSIRITDFNKDGKNEALIFGNNFNGLKLIRNEGYKLYSETLLEQSLFNDLVIMDFNQDENDDIILIDVLNNSIKFLENSEDNYFVTSREINKEETILTIDGIDFDEDGFKDLIIGNEKGIEILEGDSVYSFSSSGSIKNEYPVDNFIISDFNTDNKFDLALINKSAGSLDITFNFDSDMEKLEYPFAGISDFKILRKQDKSLLLSLSDNGYFKILSNINNYGKDFAFSAGSSANKITLYNSETNSPNLVFNTSIDNYVSLLNITSNAEIKTLYQTQLLQNYSEFACTQDMQTIIGFDLGSRLLEFVSVNKNRDKELMRLQSFVYTEFPIMNLVVDSENVIQILEREKKELYNSLIKKVDGNYQNSVHTLIDSNVVDAFIKRNGNILYWKNKNQKLYFKSFANGEYKNIIEYALTDTSKIQTFIQGDKHSSLIFTYFKIGNTVKFYILEKDKISEFALNEKKNVQLIKGNIQIFTDSDDKKFLYAYNNELFELNIFEIEKGKKLLSHYNTFEGISINDYFIDRILGKSYLVYTSSENSSVNFKVMN